MLPVFRSHRTEPRSIFDDFFNDSFLPEFSNWRKESSDSSTPAVNVKETEKEYEIEVAAPGVSKGDFKVSVDNNALTISVSKEDENKEEKEGYIRQEFNYNSFSRSFTLPENTNTESIKASHKNGLLLVEIPKEEISTTKTKEIKIN